MTSSKAKRKPKKKPQRLKTVEFRGLSLTLPARPGATLLFDLLLIESAGDDARPFLRLVQSFIGDEQLTAVRDLLRPDDDAPSVIVGLASDILGAYEED